MILYERLSVEGSVEDLLELRELEAAGRKYQVIDDGKRLTVWVSFKDWVELRFYEILVGRKERNYRVSIPIKVDLGPEFLESAYVRVFGSSINTTRTMEIILYHREFSKISLYLQISLPPGPTNPRLSSDAPDGALIFSGPIYPDDKRRDEITRKILNFVVYETRNLS